MALTSRTGAILLLACAAWALAGCGGGGALPAESASGSEREHLATAEASSTWFVETTGTAGISTDLHPAYGHAWADLDRDGWLDLWVGNHMYRPTIYRNNRDGTFTDVTDSTWTGVAADFHGGAFGDFDNDDDPDLSVLAGGSGGAKCFDKPFFVNVEGSFRNEADARNLNDRCGRGRTPLWLDWNNDGLLDLYLVNARRPQDDLSPSRMMLQRNDGTFSELAQMQSQTGAFFAQLLWFGESMHLVTYASDYPVGFHKVGDPTPRAFPWQFYSSGTASDRIADVAVGDIDGDLRDDLFIARTGPRSKAFRIREDGLTWDLLVKDLTIPRGASVNLPNATSAAFRLFMTKWTAGEVRLGRNAAPATVKRVSGDYLGEVLVWTEFTLSLDDPRLEGIPPVETMRTRGVYIGRHADGRWLFYAYTGSNVDSLQIEMRIDTGSIVDVQPLGFDAFRTDMSKVPRLLLQRNGKFVNVASAWHMAIPLACESVVAADFDNDMDLDLFMACTKPMTHTSNRLFENKGAHFEEVPLAGGGAVLHVGDPGGHVGFADYGNDGQLDVMVQEGCAVCGPPLRFGHRILLRNVRSGNRWIQFDLVGCQSNRDGIGARVFVDAGGRKQVRTANGGVHNAGQSQRRVHFGLAQNAAIDGGRVEWPSGRVTQIGALGADSIYTLVEDPSCPRN